MKTIWIEAIYSFRYTDQDFAEFTCPAPNGVLSEAVVLHHLMSALSFDQQCELSKVSIALRLNEEDTRHAAPWLFHQDSPLADGKLWLKQHEGDALIAIERAFEGVK